MKASAEICPKCRQFINWKKSWKYGFNRPVVLIPLLSLTVAIMGQINSCQSQKAQEKAQSVADDAVSITNVTLEENKLLIGNFQDAKPQVKKLIQKAFELKNGVFIPFKMGGKSIEEGFDASGFVAYLLAKVGVLDDPGYRMYSSAHLKEKFQTVDKSDVKIGDLIFFKGGFVVFYLGSLKAIGIGNEKGIQVSNVDFSRVDAIGRWWK